MTGYTIELNDGRILGYQFYGPQGGLPVLYFHGTPSSRLEPNLLYAYDINLEALLQEAGVRLIAIDRPGMGLSTYNPEGDFLSCADDAAQLLQHMHITKCSVLCWSGGGPYALAIAHQYPELIRDVTIICGFTRPFGKDVFRLMGMNKWYFYFSKYTPWLQRIGMNIVRRMKVENPPPRWIAGVPYADYALMKSRRHMEALSRCTLKEAARNGARGPVHEACLYFKDFGFDLEQIRQPVHYWWSTLDMSVIRLHAEEVERKAPNAVMHYREGEGHLSLYVRYFREVLQQITVSSER